MKILITGAKGFIGRNLIADLRAHKNYEILEFDIDSDPSTLERFCREAEFVFHLAGVNRPQNPAEFMQGNFGFTSVLLDHLRRNNNKCPIMISSSIQAELDNPYGASKKAGEDLMFAYSIQTGAPVYVYRFPNVFGKWSRPNYNSAVATFCHNIARDIPISVSSRDNTVHLVYIDDVIEEMNRAILGSPTKSEPFCMVPISYKKKLGEIVDLIQSFRESRLNLSVPDLNDTFVKALHATFLSFLPTDQFAYPLKMNVDYRGSFTEFVRTNGNGQFSVNVTKPGITKGTHWHHTKNEKFLVVSGVAKIRFRRPDTEEIFEYLVSGEKLIVVDIPVGYTHNIHNIGDSDLVTIMWANEPFNPNHPDTYFMEV
jgi:UDP-2-acetamido-2,6-beta-L-arabino-hexul-4-ose reductase